LVRSPRPPVESTEIHPYHRPPRCWDEEELRKDPDYSGSSLGEIQTGHEEAFPYQEGGQTLEEAS